MNFRVLTAGSVEGSQVISRDMLLVVETSDKGRRNKRQRGWVYM